MDELGFWAIAAVRIEPRDVDRDQCFMEFEITTAPGNFAVVIDQGGVIVLDWAGVRTPTNAVAPTETIAVFVIQLSTSGDTWRAAVWLDGDMVGEALAIGDHYQRTALTQLTLCGRLSHTDGLAATIYLCAADRSTISVDGVRANSADAKSTAEAAPGGTTLNGEQTVGIDLRI